MNLLQHLFSLFCVFLLISSAYSTITYDPGSYDHTITTSERSTIPGEVTDTGIALIKSTLKQAAALLPEALLIKSKIAFDAAPELMLGMAEFVAKNTDKIKASETFINFTTLTKTARETTLKMLDDFGKLAAENSKSLGRAVEGLGAETWTQTEKQGLHKLIDVAEDAQGDAILISMKQSGEWTDDAVKQAIELNPDGTLKNYATEGYNLGGKIPDAKITANGKEYYVESSALQNKLTSGNIQNLQNKMDQKYVQFGTTAAESTDNTITIILENGSDPSINIQSELELLMNTPDAYKNLKRAFVVDNVTGILVAKVIR